MNVQFLLPWPPSVNNYYVKTRNGVFISMKGKKYRAAVERSVLEQLGDLCLSERIEFNAILYPPDKRIRDIDNYYKAMYDAITHCDLWEDDSVVDQEHSYRGKPIKGGGVLVKLCEAGPVLPFHSTWPEYLE